MKWTPIEAWEYLDKWHYHMGKMEPYDQAVEVNKLLDMKHYPWCRTHTYGHMKVYGADCTCPYSEENPDWREELQRKHGEL